MSMWDNGKSIILDKQYKFPRQLVWRLFPKSRKIDERKAEKSGEKKFKEGQKVEMESSEM